MEIIADIVMSFLSPILGMIGTLLLYLALPLVIIFIIWLISYHIRVKKMGIEPSSSTHEIVYGNVTIGYEINPPNFRKAFNDELGMRNSCGTCTYCDSFSSSHPVCRKYGTTYEGCGCVDVTVCDDYANVLFQR